MKPRLIDANRLLEYVDDHQMISSHIIYNSPTVDAEPVRHGYWEPFDEDEYTCSLCGNIFVTMDGEHPLSNEFKFCPFCGAKMDERKEE